MNTEKIRDRLIRERDELTSQHEALAITIDSQDDDYGVSQHTADNATDVFLRDRNLALRRNADHLIAQIDGALARIESGTYGICQRCNQPIAEERLEALPYAAYCISCQALMEGAAAERAA